MKVKLIGGILLGIIVFGITGVAWSRVVVLPRRRVVVRPRHVRVYPGSRPRIVYYRYPAVKTVYVPSAYPVYYRYPFPRCEAENVDVEIKVEVDD